MESFYLVTEGESKQQLSLPVHNFIHVGDVITESALYPYSQYGLAFVAGVDPCDIEEQATLPRQLGDRQRFPLLDCPFQRDSI